MVQSRPFKKIITRVPLALNYQLNILWIEFYYVQRYAVREKNVIVYFIFSLSLSLCDCNFRDYNIEFNQIARAEQREYNVRVIF